MGVSKMTHSRNCPRNQGSRLLSKKTATKAATSLFLISTAFTLAFSNQSAAQTGKLSTPLAVDWRYTGNPYGNNPSSPIVANGSVYFTSGNYIYAVSSMTGALKWKFPEGGIAFNSFVTVSPALKGNTLFVGGGDGLYAIDTETGKQKWRYNLTRGGVSTSPVVVDDNIYFIAAGRVLALNCETGDSLGGNWGGRARAGVDAGGEIITDMTVMDHNLLYGTPDLLHAVDAVTGNVKWYTSITGLDHISQPVVSGDVFSMIVGSTLVVRRSTGLVKKTLLLPAAAVVPPATDPDGNFYVVTEDRHIYALNSQLKGLWRVSPVLDFLPLAPPVVSDGILVVSTALGGIFAYDTATGTPKWNYRITPSGVDNKKVPLRTNIASKSVVVGGSLFVLSDDGTLSAFRHDAPDGLPPTVTILEPEQGDYVSGKAPFIVSAKISDQGSGIDLKSIVFKLDNQTIPMRPLGVEEGKGVDFEFLSDEGVIRYVTRESDGVGGSLKDGHHTATVMAKDWMGNTVTKSWVFYTDNTFPRKSRKAQANGGTGGFPGGGGSPSGPGGFGGGKGGGGGN